MLLLTNKSENRAGRSNIVILFGLGLIGTAIKQYLELAGHDVANEPESFAWDDEVQQKIQLKKIKTHIRELLKRNNGLNVQIIWSAGKAGFGGQAADFEPEMKAFQRVLKFSRECSNETGRAVCFHLMSSAGGIFEGQRCVSWDSPQLPQRLYGEIKLRQEAELHRIENIRPRVYRPSSVYGYYNRNGRQGLITTMLRKGLLGQVIHIYGRPNTLRDFVFVEDIGRFVVDQIELYDASTDAFFLVNGKPNAMHEIIMVMQRLIKKSLYLHYVTGNDNTKHISFSPSVKNPAWRPTALPIGVEKTLMTIYKNMSLATL